MLVRMLLCSLRESRNYISTYKENVRSTLANRERTNAIGIANHEHVTSRLTADLVREPIHRSLRWWSQKTRKAFSVTFWRHKAGLSVCVMIDMPDRDLAQILNSIQCIVWTANREGVLDYVNAAWNGYTGFDVTLPTKWDWIPAVHPSCRNAVKRSWIEAIATGQPYSARYKLRGRDGKDRWFEANATLIESQTGKPYWAGTLTDVHNAIEDDVERRKLEERLRQQEKILSGLVAASPLPTALLRAPCGKILYTNDLLFEAWRLRRRDHEYLSEYELRAFHDDGTPFNSEDWPEWHCLRGVSNTKEHVAVIRDDGSRCVFAMTGVPLNGGHDRATAAVVFFEDITEKLRKEETALTERVLRERVEMRSAFLSIVSHEIKTPLTAGIASASLLKPAQLTVEQREHFNTMQEGYQLALRRVDDLLDIARLELGEVKVIEVVFRLREHLNSVVHAYDAPNVDITLDVAHDVPECLIGDATKFDRLIAVVIDNSVKFRREENATVRVSCRKAPVARNASVSLLIEISDEGIGIPTDEIPHLFTTFTQREWSRDRRYGGNGVGLGIGRKLCEVLGGSIHISSVLEQGTTVYIEIPMTVGAGPTGDSAHGNRSTVNVESHDRRSKRILVAEDNALSARVLLKILRLYGYSEVDIACDGVAAYERFSERHYDLVLMDCQMPRMDGYKSTELIRQTDATTPILALSADSSLAEGSWEAVGMNAYIEKPYHADELIKILDGYLF